MLSPKRLALHILLVLVLVPLAGLAADDETYNLRGPSPEKGQIYIISAKSNSKDMVRKSKGKEDSDEVKFDETGTSKKEVEVLAVENGEITRLRTKVLKDQRVQIFRKGKKEAKIPRDRDLHGQIIYSERIKTGWKNSLEDVKPDSKQKRALKDHVPFKEDDLLLPAEKVKVGHTWKIEQPLFDKIFGSQLEKMRASGTGKFLRFEKVDGEDLAVIEIEFTMTGKSNEDEMSLDVHLKSKNIAYRSLKLGIDRKSSQVTNMTMKGIAEIDDEKRDLEFNAVINSDETVELKPKK